MPCCKTRVTLTICTVFDFIYRVMYCSLIVLDFYSAFLLILHDVCFQVLVLEKLMQEKFHSSSICYLLYILVVLSFGLV